MKLSIILTTLLSTLANTAPNLCDVVYRNALGKPITDDVGQTLARYCQWSGPDVPTLGSDVCCTIDDDGAACSKSSDGKCPAETQRWYCEHGSEDALGGVTCYQPFPDGCDAGMCFDGQPDPSTQPQKSEYIMCCSAGGVCQHVPYGVWPQDCQGELFACHHGWVDNDGYIECWD